MIRFHLVALLLLFWNNVPYAAVEAAPCQTLGFRQECEAPVGATGQKMSCFWCNNTSVCADSEASCPPPAASTGKIPCNQLKSVTDCTVSSNCTWCGSTVTCQDAARKDCPVVTLGPPSSDVCNITETPCLNTAGCIWCAQNGVCRPGQSVYAACLGDSGHTAGGAAASTGAASDAACLPLDIEVNCTASKACTWCAGMDMCRSAARGCPGGGNPVSENMNFYCHPFGNETACVEAGPCFWCPGDGMCKASFGDCPGNSNVASRPNLCAPLGNETECMDNGCAWCGDLCRGAEAECPGQGRENPCMNQPENVCNTTVGCAWLDIPNRCGSERGHASEQVQPGNGPGGFGGAGNACPLLTNEGNCTATVECRWCPSSNECQTKNDACADGSLGVRGNPCHRADSEGLCTAIDGCLWCLTGQMCSQATDNACEPNNGGPRLCHSFDAEPECNDDIDCQWCTAQSVCKNNHTKCFEPSGQVNIDIGGNNSGGSFHIRDNGLGPTDPNAVSVVLSYLYEIAQDGETIGPSLVDMEYQDFNVTQTLGSFFGGIQARNVQFEAVIDGVGTIEMQAYIMLTNGTVAAPGGNESWPVQPGDVKFNVVMKNWTFCGDTNPCGDSNATSAYVDVAFRIKGNFIDPQQSTNNSLLFNLGGNVPLLLFGQVDVDGVVQDMPDGFPRAESTASQGPLFVFRFPRFLDSVQYDPVISYHYSIPILSTSAPTQTPSKAPITSPTSAPAPAPTPAPPKKASKKSLSGGAIAGIVIGSLVGLCCCCALLGLMAARKKGNRAEAVPGEPDEKNNLTIDGDDAFADEAESSDDEEGESEEDDEETESDDDDEESESSAEIA